MDQDAAIILTAYSLAVKIVASVKKGLRNLALVPTVQVIHLNVS